MSSTITLNAVPYQLRGELKAEQVSMLVSLIAGANLIDLPTQAKWVNAIGFAINVAGDGSGNVIISFKQ